LITADRLDRDEQLARMGGEQFDVAVIGGGINGAAIARDGAMRGLRMALIERDDFAGATSSRSSKLIHGGLRYLPQRQFRLVREALAERERLRHVTAPHLVRPINFIFPVYGGRRPSRLTLSAGLSIYDAFARTAPLERHRWIPRGALISRSPRLDRATLKGGVSYFDGWADDARLTIENMLDAAANGAAVANYLEVTGFERAGGRIVAAPLRDRIGGANIELRSKVFINASGPWTDIVRRLDEPGVPSAIRLTKGVHIVFDRAALPLGEALVMAGGDGRIVFATPHASSVIVGTTDTDFDGDPATVAAAADDVGYLIDFMHGFIVDSPGTANVLASYAGLRALTSTVIGRAPSSVSREQTILTSAAGLISVAGGKLTTHRAIAEQVIALALSTLGKPVEPSPTLTTPLPGARPIESHEKVAKPPNLEANIWRILIDRYGSRAEIVARIVDERPGLEHPLADGVPAIGAEVVFAVRHEMARTLADFMIRRTSLNWRAPRQFGLAARRAAAIMGVEMGWDDRKIAYEIASLVAAEPGPESTVAAENYEHARE